MELAWPLSASCVAGALPAMGQSIRHILLTINQDTSAALFFCVVDFGIAARCMFAVASANLAQCCM